MESLLKDLRYTLRGLRRAPAFTIPLLVTFALGLGANTTVFTVLSAVLLRPLPYPQPERLVRMSLLALWLPARRALRTDPALVLREEA
ncbi:MAG TPA: hypothetical protein VN923_13865 [Thermoanaerobaculia bacterium]|nr:hypothetical protein [Thermoanaerobaculia bacterium]